MAAIHGVIEAANSSICNEGEASRIARCERSEMIVLLKSVRCLFGYHGHTLWDQHQFVCEDCFAPVPILVSEIVRGPKAEPEIVRGAPTNTKVKIHAERSKIRAFR